MSIPIGFILPKSHQNNVLPRRAATPSGVFVCYFCAVMAIDDCVVPGGA